MSASLSFRCSSCQARIKAPIQLLGQTRACPKCGNLFVVQPKPPMEEMPLLVPDDKPNQDALAIFSTQKDQSPEVSIPWPCRSYP